MSTKIIFTSLLVLALTGAGYWYYMWQPWSQAPIGGVRDEAGCLVAAGYSFNEEVGACVREFELSQETRRAAQIAVAEVGSAYALTVVGVSAQSCEGCYTVALERGEEREPVAVEIVDWVAVPARTVSLYYYDPARDEDAGGNIQCSRAGLVPVERQMRSGNPIEDTLQLLLEGKLTAPERAQGITTEFPLSGLTLDSATLSDEGVLTLLFNDPQNKTSGGACRAGVLWFQIEATAKQFPEVAEVRFEPEYLFQP